LWQAWNSSTFAPVALGWYLPFFIGKFNVEYHRDFFLINFINQELVSRRTGLRIRGTTGESGVIFEAVSIREITERKTVANTIVLRAALSTTFWNFVSNSSSLARYAVVFC
jgi:hypothetical protein